jgi:hypothetical protein
MCVYNYLFLTAVGLTLGGSSTVHICTQTTHRIQNLQDTENYTECREWTQYTTLADNSKQELAALVCTPSLPILLQ